VSATPGRIAPAVLTGALDGFDASYPRFLTVEAKYRALVDSKGQIIDVTEGDDGRFVVERRTSAGSARQPVKASSGDRAAIAALVRRAAENERGKSTEDTAITQHFREHHEFATRLVAQRN
jgi:hypothetical protein